MLRLSGAHLHLCFDGSEPPSTVHYQAHMDLEHNLPGASAAHEDMDIPLVGELFRKASKSGFDLPVFLVGLWILWALFVAEKLLTPAFRRLFVHSSSPRALLPPLRGPPFFNLR